MVSPSSRLPVPVIDFESPSQVSLEQEFNNYEEELKVDVFHLHRLPLVAKEHIYCMMTPLELIDISMASSKAKRSVTSFFRTKPKFQVTLQLFGKPTIIMNQKENDNIYTFPYEVETFSETSIVDCMKWYENVKNVLCCCINKVWLSSPNSLITDWLRSQEESFEEVVVIKGCLNDVKYFLGKLRVSKILFLNINYPTGNSQLEIPRGPHRLIINNANFLNCEQLPKLDSPCIELRNSILTSQEIIRFLKSWMSMESNFGLEFIRINVSGQEPKEEIIDLLNEVGTHHDVIPEKLPGNFKITSGHKIKRSDGKTATIVWHQSTSWTLFMLTH